VQTFNNGLAIPPKPLWWTR